VTIPRPQDWVHGIAIAGLAGGAAAAAAGRRRIAMSCFAGVGVCEYFARWLSRRHPSPFRAAFRFLLVHSKADRERLCRELRPRPGERILEIGPGAGQHGVDVASRLTPGGRLDVVDIQPKMLDAIQRRARRMGVGGITATTADACQPLPFDPGTFDGAYLASVLGEVPDPHVTLREVRQLLRPEGRLVVAESYVLDPDCVRLRTLRRWAEEAGFQLQSCSHTYTGYAARFSKHGC
jgi:ubiquinone/menaquinone biosynthesis C-methylase UbiE